MPCEEIRDLYMQRLMDELDPDADLELDSHLSTCAECRAFARLQARTDLRLDAVRSLPPLPSQRSAMQARLPGARRKRLTAQLTRGLAGLAAAAVIMLAAFGAWRVYQRTTPVPINQPAPVLSADFFDQRRPGAGWVATAKLPVLGGNATAYYYIEPGAGDQVRAAILIKWPDGRLTREIDLGEVSHGRLPFTQPEFRLLTIGSYTLLAVATDQDGEGRLQVAAYHPAKHRLVLVPFGREPWQAISTWPVSTPGGIRTQSRTGAADWELTEGIMFVPVSRSAPPRPEMNGATLAEAELTTPDGPMTVRLFGTMTQGASLYLHRPDGRVTEEVELGRPNFGLIPLTQPKLHKLKLGQTEVLALLADPMVGAKEQAALRIFAYDPARRQLRLVPFATGEAVVDRVPAASGDLLVTHQAAGELRWRLTEHWLLEK